MEATDVVVSRVQKHIDTLKTKTGKLAEENSRLKQQLADLKASHSRIRRIPKKPAAAAPTTDEAPATA
jgi:cell division septum initiation protein DivIVA